MNFVKSPTGAGPLVCVETSCPRRGIKVFSTSEMCSSCGEQMFDEEDLHPMEVEQLTMEGVHFDGGVFDGGRSFSDVKPGPPPVDTFSCPPDLTGCPIAKRTRAVIPLPLYNRWIFLAGQLRTEWIAYLYGREGDGVVEITGMYFPKQRVTSTHCEAEEGEIRPGTVGTVHSHVGMKAFFSAEDALHFNHPIELVVNDQGDIEGNGRTKLECGRFHRGPAEIEFTDCDEETALEDQLRAAATHDTRQFTAKSGNQGGHGR